jgi:hypothetical protein
MLVVVSFLLRRHLELGVVVLRLNLGSGVRQQHFHEVAVGIDVKKSVVADQFKKLQGHCTRGAGM